MNITEIQERAKQQDLENKERKEKLARKKSLDMALREIDNLAYRLNKLEINNDFYLQGLKMKVLDEYIKVSHVY